MLGARISDQTKLCCISAKQLAGHLRLHTRYLAVKHLIKASREAMYALAGSSGCFMQSELKEWTRSPPEGCRLMSAEPMTEWVRLTVAKEDLDAECLTETPSPDILQGCTRNTN